MAAREAAPGEPRRFDLVTAYSNVSPYAKQCVAFCGVFASGGAGSGGGPHG